MGHSCVPPAVDDTAYEDNLRLSRTEYLQQHIYLQSWPRCLGIVLGNACNIDCPHCYQAKNGDNLLKPPEIGWELRREFAGFYPYLSTLGVQGGEAFAFAGFRELIEDVGATVRRPILSVATNGTLIDEEWAEKIVRTPFRNLTVSIDGGTPETYARLRRGADLGEVLANVRRIQRWKEKLGSEFPYLDSFFVVMRSNFREIPRYLRLMAEYGFLDVALQTMSITPENSSREPSLVRDEAIADIAEVVELHALMRELLPRERRHFRMIRTSGLTSLFQQHGLDASFLEEQAQGLYPDSEDLAKLPEPGEPGGTMPLCPNPWTNLFVAENGDVHLCFLSVPVGNLYEAPLATIWNSPRAMAKRSQTISGRYLAAGCSAQWCSWREGEKAVARGPVEIATLRTEMKELAGRAGRMQPLVPIEEGAPKIAAVRRVLAERDRRIRELETMFVELCQVNGTIHDKGQGHIAHLEEKCEKGKERIARLEEECEEGRGRIAQLEEECRRLRRPRGWLAGKVVEWRERVRRLWGAI